MLNTNCIPCASFTDIRTLTEQYMGYMIVFIV